MIFLPQGAGPKSADEILAGPPELAGNAAIPRKRVAMKSRRTPEGYAMEIGLSWDCLAALKAARKSMLGFTISVRDHGADFMERRRVIWAGDDKNYIDTARFGLLRLAE